MLDDHSFPFLDVLMGFIYVVYICMCGVMGGFVRSVESCILYVVYCIVGIGIEKGGCSFSIDFMSGERCTRMVLAGALGRAWWRPQVV